MDTRQKISLLLGLLLLASLTSVGTASAATAERRANVITTNQAGIDSGTYNSVTEFHIGEAIYIIVTGLPDGKTADVSVTAWPSGDPVPGATWLDQTNGAILSFTVTTPGDYDITVNGLNNRIIAFATIFVVPETLLGSLMAFATGLAVFGLFNLKKRIPLK